MTDLHGRDAAAALAAPPAGLPSVLIITPTYNEANNVTAFVSAVHRVLPWAHVLVVDDASPDGTGAIADRLAERDPRVSVLHRRGKLGLGTAYVEGFAWGLERGFDLLFEMDADLSHDPAHLPAFLAAFDRGADVVVGSRNIEGGGVRGWGAGRNALSKGGSLYSRVVLGVGVRDLTTGFKGYTRRALGAIGTASLESNGYSFQIETTFRALRAGLRVVEVPIVFVDRRAGESKMNGRIFLEAVGIVWKLRLGLRPRPPRVSSRFARLGRRLTGGRGRRSQGGFRCGRKPAFRWNGLSCRSCSRSTTRSRSSPSFTDA